jgi:hypothetical protein
LSRLDPSSVRINGQPIDPNGLYWVALTEQLHKFLNSMGLTPFNSVETGLFEYNVVRDFMAAKKILNYRAEGRIIDTAAK